MNVLIAGDEWPTSLATDARPPPLAGHDRLARIIHESRRMLRKRLPISLTRKRVKFAALTRLRVGLVFDRRRSSPTKRPRHRFGGLARAVLVTASRHFEAETNVADLGRRNIPLV
jgi:hypothetical protein